MNCPDCDGEGYLPCEYYGGRGLCYLAEYPDDEDYEGIECPEGHTDHFALGFCSGDACETCGGEGELSDTPLEALAETAE